MDYVELAQAIQDYTDNQEPTFLDMIPTFVKQAEERIYGMVSIPELRKNVTGVTTLGNAYLTRPADYVSMYEFSVLSSGTYYYLDNKDVSFLREAYPGASTQGRPKYYAEFDGATDTTDGHWMLGPVPDAAYTVEIHYQYNPESIVDANTSWLGENASAALLYGALIEAYTFMKGDADMLKQYDMQYKEALALLGRTAAQLKRDEYRAGQRG